MTGLESSIDGHIELGWKGTDEGEEWWGRRVEHGAAAAGKERGTMRVDAQEGLGPLLLVKLCDASSCLLCCSMRKRRERKEKKGREKEKKEIRKKFKPEKILWRKIKYNLWSWFKIIFVKGKID
jgi:hypothetical protein